MKEEKVKYLVRRLTEINDKGMEQIHSLVYFEGMPVGEKDGTAAFKECTIRPFDRERAGFSYIEELTVRT